MNAIRIQYEVFREPGHRRCVDVRQPPIQRFKPGQLHLQSVEGLLEQWKDAALSPAVASKALLRVQSLIC